MAVTVPPAGRVYSADELIGFWGVRVNEERRCTCCGKFNLYAVSYGVGNTLLLCSRCDKR